MQFQLKDVQLHTLDSSIVNTQFHEFFTQIDFSIPLTGLDYKIKRFADISLSVIALAVCAPILILIAILIKLTSEGPAFYHSLRVGKDYKPFYMLKFRTMISDADNLRAELRKSSNQGNQLFKLANDPRVTPLGQFLRNYSLDELPQLINVLRGEMSLVGPRPLPPDESHLFEPPFTCRFKVIPGMTGAWQVKGRSHLSFEEMCFIELYYVSQWTLLEDCKILFKTIPAVIRKHGAC